MYNEQQKQKFIDTVKLTDESAVIKIRLLFNRLEDIEEKLGYDICNAKISEYPKYLFQVYDFSAYAHYYANILFLLRYRLFCENNSYIDVAIYMKNKFESFEITDSYWMSQFTKYNKKSSHNDMLCSPQNLFDYLRTNILDDSWITHKENIPNVFTLDQLSTIYLMLCFYGLSNEEIENLKNENIWFPSSELEQECIVRSGDISINLDKNISELIKKRIDCNEIYTERCKSPLTYKMSDIYFFLYEGDEIGKNNRIQKIYYKYLNAKSSSEASVLKINHIREYGILYRLYTDIKKVGVHIEDDQIIKLFRKRTGASITTKAKKNDIVIKYRQIEEYHKNNS